MRKLLIGVLIALLLLITVYSIIKGLSIGNIKILGFNNIKNESEKIDNGIVEITKMKEQTYKKTLSDIESNAKTLLKEKETYASLVTTSTDSEIEKATHEQKYEQEFLWAKVGNHATAQNVKLKFEVKVGAVNKNNYDLYFTVTGKYMNITEFVMSLENDNLLDFKIENFKMIPQEEKKEGSTTSENKNTSTGQSSSEKGMLQATFKVTDIAINIDKTKFTSSSANTNSNNQTNTVNANTTNTTTNANITTNTNTAGTTEGVETTE